MPPCHFLLNTDKSKMESLTPIEYKDGVWFKRDDKYRFYGLYGAKVRGAKYLIQKGLQEGYRKFTTVGHRKSPQIHIVGTICQRMQLDFVGHAPMGKLPEAFKDFDIRQHRAGYNNVIAARCREFAKDHGYFEIPFGMIQRDVIMLTAQQIFNIPNAVKRLVVPVGSGVNLCGILHAFKQQKIKTPIIGVVVGRRPEGFLKDYAPFGWRSMVTFVDALEGYSKEAETTEFYDIELDPIYEAKCVPFIKKGDLFWIIGKRTF